MKLFLFSIFILLYSMAELGAQVNYYSYQSGDWNSATTWTTDPGGTLWVQGGIPGNSDNVIILNGRTVRIDDNARNINSLIISYGGTVDLQGTSGHNFWNGRRTRFTAFQVLKIFLVVILQVL
ncbi:MAG: hypothetical protein HC905_08570 [Bacteroidales bacterium]|nr:hypothetical protein [Bacteroidales bacterium]